MNHQLDGLLDAPHGVVDGVLLPHVIRDDAWATPDRLVDLAAAELLAAHVCRLANDVGVPQRLGELGVTAADIPRPAHTTLDDACFTTNPRSATVAEITRLLQDAL